MPMNLSRGFTMVELAITLVVMGILLAFSIPAFQSINQSYQLHGATENLAAQLRIAREKALATGVDQPMHVPNSTIYHIHYAGGIGTVWTLPRGITVASGVGSWFHMQKDGRCQESGLIVLQDRRGNRDTVSVQLSGLVLTK